MPFKAWRSVWNNKNSMESSDSFEILSMLRKIDKHGKHIRACFIDTVNTIMVDREMNESKKLTFDKWYDLAKDIWSMISEMSLYRKDLIIVMMFHIGLYTDVDGKEKKTIMTNGKKLEKIKLESKLPVMLYTRINMQGEKRNYQIETTSFNSTAKSPMDMFDVEVIPNDMSLVLKGINEYYELFTDAANPDYKVK